MKTITIPSDVVKIGSYTYRLKIMDDSDVEVGGSKGFCDFNNRVIHLSNLGDIHETLLHEVMHAICNFLDMRKFVDQEDENCEGIVTQISKGFMMFAIDNPDLANFILKPAGRLKKHA